MKKKVGNICLILGFIIFFIDNRISVYSLVNSSFEEIHNSSISIFSIISLILIIIGIGINIKYIEKDNKICEKE